ncbi:hypothetical protein RUM43_009375 [Polyplax serrata]|uniref:Protein big brother n=1 Tax=Polyplax serrata TaxID=468196 RepID=A0AAN8S243_POLSC
MRLSMEEGRREEEETPGDLLCCRAVTHTQVHLRSHFIMNGVCVRWRGWIDLDRLDGVGCLEYDEDKAQMEDSMLRDQIERYNQRLRDFEEKQRAYRGQQERSAEQELEVGNDNRERKSKGQKKKTLGEAFFCNPWKVAEK